MSTDDRSSSAYVDRQTTKVVAQLLKAVPTIHHVDELFQLLAYTIVQQFGIQVVQVWVDQVDHTGQMTIQLQTLVRQDSTVLEQVVANGDVAQVAQRIANEYGMDTFRSVDSQFSSYRATMLKRYGLNYCAGYQVRQGTGLPAMRNTGTYASAASFLAIVTLLFVKQIPHPDLLSMITFIMDQGVSIAEKHGLLLPPTAVINETHTPTPYPISSQHELPLLTEIIPRHKDAGDLMLSSNPFNSAPVIKDKAARRLYGAIDGRKSVAALCQSTGMSTKEVYAALQVLLSQQRIEMHEANGKLVDASIFLK
jgi:hypothetical protein